MSAAETGCSTRPAHDLPKVRHDRLPLALIPALMLLGMPFIGSPQTWLTLTVAGLAMGMMIFLTAAGLTLVFGLMDVLNFGHGAFIAVGAYVATSVLLPLSGWTLAPGIFINMAALTAAVVAAMLVTGMLGWVFERIIIRPVYGNGLLQILVTLGSAVVTEQMLRVIFGPDQIPLRKPESFRGALMIGDAAIEKYRLIAVVFGLAVFVGMVLVLDRTRIGILIRAGVENREMVEALGYRVRRLFVAVFVAGSALAGLGGVMWGLYQETVTSSMGGDVLVLVLIVIIIGGLGSVGGCFIGALLVGLMTNYIGFLMPKISLVSDVLLMVVILMWRPEGLYSVRPHA